MSIPTTSGRLDPNGNVPQDELIAVAIASYKENIFWDWSPEQEDGWDAIVGDIGAEIDRREINPLKQRIADLEAALDAGAGAVRDAVLDALIAEAEPIDACEDIEVCGWHSVSGWLRDHKEPT